MKRKPLNNNLVIGAIFIVAVLILFNQWQISQLSQMLGGTTTKNAAFFSVSKKAELLGSVELDKVDLSSIQNTAQAMMAVLPIGDIKIPQDAIDKLVPTGIPVYGEALGISYDQPIPALHALQRLYPSLKNELKTNDPETWQRYLRLATKPVGISCEFCCGVGVISISGSGEMRCGCSHNPAIHALTMWLMKNTDMTDAEVLQEVLRWKTIWFPKNMIGLATQLAGGDASALHSIPGMVGGC